MGGGDYDVDWDGDMDDDDYEVDNVAPDVADYSSESSLADEVKTRRVKRRKSRRAQSGIEKRSWAIAIVMVVAFIIMVVLILLS